ncbi:HAD family hydrolase [Marinobacter sp. JSM 1782161]|uniref:HAD family hydrolase n=1 Tax=Marinobacter sp. JSM 1782161 TaxID=2685906 RepID=UPI001D192175|nr:HAD family hydrolase [Marinobacter sp. JSM 1782161]
MGTRPAPRFDALAFDLDGTLVDSGLDFAALRRTLGFPEGIGLLEHIATLDDPAAVDHAHRVIHRFEMEGARGATWMPGARELLDHLRDAGVPVAILTRNSRAAVAATDAALSLGVELILTRDDAPPKPDPAGLLHIAETLGVAADRMAYVGDFIDDLTTARRAGMVAGLYRNHRNSGYADQADFVVRHFDELRTQQA